MLKVNNYGFTLIEVMIASLILSVTVFGVLRLSNNNTNQVNLIEKNKEMYEIFYNSSECLKSFGTGYLAGISSTQSLNFGTDNSKCLTGVYNTGLSFTGIKINSYLEGVAINPNEYYSYFITSNSTDSIIVSNYISDGKNVKKFDFNINK